MGKLVCGVGVYEKGKFSAYLNGKATKEYNLWKNMLVRCYSQKARLYNKSYVDCAVSDNFKNFQWFSEWCQRQVGFGMDGYHLDKDYLGSGKLYSEDFCVFVPKEPNGFLTDNKAVRGKYVIGVHLDKKSFKYVAQINYNDTRKHLGYFEDESSAFAVYKKSKEAYAQELASKYSGYVDPRVILSLQNFKVSCRKYVKGEDE